MDDILHCPICGNKLRTSHLTNKLLHPTGKTANYAERVCADGYNHVVVVSTDKATKKVDLFKFSIDSYARSLEIDYINQRCRIICGKAGKYEYIEIAKMLEPDFPNLEKLKERVKLLLVFS